MRIHKSIQRLAESWPVTIHPTTYGRKSWGYDICLAQDHDTGQLVTPWRHDTGEEYCPVRLAAIEPAPGGRWRVMCHEVTRQDKKIQAITLYVSRMGEAAKALDEHFCWYL